MNIVKTFFETVLHVNDCNGLIWTFNYLAFEWSSCNRPKWTDFIVAALLKKMCGCGVISRAKLSVFQ